MRHIKYAKLMISIFTFASIVSAAGAIKLCQLDWFQAWRSKSGILSNNDMSYTSNSGSRAESGTWSVTSDEGSPGVKHTVSGQSQCSETGCSSPPCTTSMPWPSATLTANKYCWCRMIAPNLGASWVFDYAEASVNYCTNFCADFCASCVRMGLHGSCTRSAILALP
jgi:hypothetical protein